MVIAEKLSSVALLLLNAARSRGTVGFRDLHALFAGNAHKNDVYDTLEAASRALSPSSVAIYSAVMAKNSDGCPGSGFYDIFNNLHRDEFKVITGHNDLHQLDEENRKAIVAVERDRVYRNVEEHF